MNTHPALDSMQRMQISLGIVLMMLVTANVQAQEDVHIIRPDGFALHATYYSGETNGPGILLLHQCDRRGERTGFEELAEELVSRGFHVIIPDYRTYGKSVDDNFPSGAWQRAGGHTAGDLEAVYQFIVEQPWIDSSRIGIAGASCGGRHAIELAAQHEQVKALVFMSTQVGARILPGYQTVAHLPVFCIVSEADPYGSTTQSMETVFSTSEHVDSRLQVYKGSAHGTPLLERDQSLVAEIADWFETHVK